VETYIAIDQSQERGEHGKMLIMTNIFRVMIRVEEDEKILNL
jgi:hypothetical protein